MQIFKSSFIILILLSCSAPRLIKKKADLSGLHHFYDYSIDLRDRADDVFKVKLKINQLSEADSLYYFPSSIPGSYSIKDFGRYVQSFKAFDAENNELNVVRNSTNSWKISKANLLNHLSYQVKETWDTKVDSNEVGLMSGTSIEDDHVLFNTHAVIGFFKNHQDKKIRLNFNYDANWMVGTANELNDGKQFYYTDYADLVDSPLLFGNLTATTVFVDDVQLDIFSYSKSGKNEAADFSSMIADVYDAFQTFIKRKPVTHYTFLFHFEEKHYGALEHKKSSVYIYKDEEDASKLRPIVRDVVAHEIYHLQTPLWIRSERINDFDFTKAKSVDHLWFYEGVTEWASHAILFRNKLETINEFFKEYNNKISRAFSSRFDQNLSLLELSRESFSKSDEYINIYQKGAITAMLLDIHILNATAGKKGLREVVNALAKEYSLKKAFSSKDFFKDLIGYSHPSVKQFVNDYIKGSKKLPIAYYFSMLGLEYFEELEDDKTASSLGYGLWNPNSSTKLVARQLTKKVQEMGLMETDTLVELNAKFIDEKNFSNLLDELDLGGSNIGKKYRLKVKRKNEIYDLELRTIQRTYQNVFRGIDAHLLTNKMITLKKAWFGKQIN